MSWPRPTGSTPRCGRTAGKSCTPVPRPGRRNKPGVPREVTMDTSVTGTKKAPTATGLEIRSIEYVPTSERHGTVWHLGPLWFAGNAQLATIAIGAFGIAGGLSFSWSIVAIVLGALIGTLFMAFHSAQGPKLGLPQMIQSRPQFGYYGALLPVIVAVALFIGYNVFNTEIAAVTVQQTAGTDITVSTIIICGIAFV